MSKKIGVIIQARTGSTRLPEKVLLDLPCGSGIPVLQQVVSRCRRSKYASEIIVATTNNPSDDRIVELVERLKVKIFRGSETDVLERYYKAAKKYELDVVVRITADCPCVDAEIIDLLIEKHLDSGADYTSNTLQRTFPHGLDVEIIEFRALEIAHYECKNPKMREHVTMYIYSNPQQFKCENVKAPAELTLPELRITLDDRRDYILLCSIYDYLYVTHRNFSWKEIIELVRQKPWLMEINKDVRQKRVFSSMKEEISEAIRYLKLQEFTGVAEILESLADKYGK